MDAFNLSPKAQEALDALISDAMATGSFYIVSHLDEVRAVSAGSVGRQGSAADVMLAVLDRDDMTKNFNIYKSSLVQDFIDALGEE